MRLGSVTSLALALGAGAALAQSSGPPPSAAPSKAVATKDAPALPSRPNAAEAIAECILLWDRATHMTKQEWSRTCRRVQSRLDGLKVENLEFPKAGRSRKGS